MSFISPSEVASENHLPHWSDAGEKAEVRLQAVLALLSGESTKEVQGRFNISRSNLYSYKRRALEAMREVLKDKKRGPHHPYNRLSEEQEESVKVVCQRHPTFSSYQVKEQMGSDAPTPRTIQRVRWRLGLPRLSKRDMPRSQRKRFSVGEKRLIGESIKNKLYLGPMRLAWDLCNQHDLQISPSTVGRMKKIFWQR
jgi:transposase